MEAQTEIQSSSSFLAVNRVVLLLVLFVACIHLPLIFSDSVLWDGVPLKNAFDDGDLTALKSVFRASGYWHAMYLHSALGSLPGYVHWYKLVAFASILGSTVCIFYLCKTAGIWGDAESFAVAAVAAAYPFYSVWFELIMLPYALAYLSFSLGAVCYSRYLLQPAPAKKILVASAAALFLLSFPIESFMVYFYALFLFFFLRDAGRVSLRAGWRFIGQNVCMLALPPIFFVARRLASPSTGMYEDYNQIRFSLLGLFKWLVVVPKRIVLDQARDFITFLSHEPSFFLVLLVYCSVLTLACGLVARRLASRSLNRREFAGALGFATILFLMGTFPYAAVSKFPIVNTYQTRHALLASLPIAIGAVACLRFAARGSRQFLVATMVLLVGCFVIQTRNYILWQNRYIKYLAIIEELKRHGDTLGDIVIVEDKSHIGMPELCRTVEINWIMKQAFANERHIGFDVSMANEFEFRQKYHVDKLQWYMMRDLKPSPNASAIEVRDASSRSEIGIYLQYLLGGASERSELLQSLVELEIHPTQVSWPVPKLPTQGPQYYQTHPQDFGASHRDFH